MPATEQREGREQVRGVGALVLDRPELVRRLADRPVADATSIPGYGAVFNAGVLYDEGTYHLFARAVRSGYYRNPGPGDQFVDWGPYLADLDAHTLLKPEPGALGVGAGAPPVVTEEGLLLFFP